MLLYTIHWTHNFFYCICTCVIIELIYINWLLLASGQGFWIWEEYSICSPVKGRLSVSPGTKIYSYHLQCTHNDLQQAHWSEKTANWIVVRGKHRQTGSTAPGIVWHGSPRRNNGTTERIEFVFFLLIIGLTGSLSRVRCQGSISKYCQLMRLSRLNKQIIN